MPECQDQATGYHADSLRKKSRPATDIEKPYDDDIHEIAECGNQQNHDSLFHVAGFFLRFLAAVFQRCQHDSHDDENQRQNPENNRDCRRPLAKTSTPNKEVDTS